MVADSFGRADEGVHNTHRAVAVWTVGREGGVEATAPQAATTSSAIVRSGTRHPPPVTALPTLRCRPLLLSGIPVFREILDFARVTPTARFQEKPPLFTWAILRSRVGRNRRAAASGAPDSQGRCARPVNGARAEGAPRLTAQTGAALGALRR